MSFEEQIKRKHKYPNIVSRQMDAIVFIILQIFFATLAVLKIGEYSVTRRVQTHRTRVKIFDIISGDIA